MRTTLASLSTRRFSIVAACLAAWCTLGQTALAQTFPTLNTGSSVSWNTTLWTLGGTPPQTSTQVGLLQGGGTMTIDATSTNTTPGGLLIGWYGNFTVAMTGGTLTTGTTAGDGLGTFGLTVGESGVGTFSQTGGLVTAPLVNLGRFTAGSAGTYTLTGGTLATAQILRGPGTGTLNLNGGTLRVTGTAAALIGSTVTTNVQSGGAFIDTNGFNATIASAVSGSGSLAKSGSGTLALSGTTTYTGTTTVNAGVLQFVNPTSLYGGTTANWTAANIVAASGATLAVSVGASNFTTGNVTTLLTNLGGLGGAVNNNGLQAGSAIGFDTSNAVGTFTVADSIQNSTGTGGGAIGVMKLGVGTLALSGANTYTGTTTVSAGVLQFVNPTSLYGGTTANWTAANIVAGSGATVAVSVGASNFTAGNVTTLLTNLGGLGGAVNNNGLQAGSAIGFDTSNAGGTFTVSDVIQNSTGTGGGAVGVMKLGSGTLALTGVNTYTGTTTINAGVLQVGSGATGSLSASSVITGSAGGTLAFGRTDGYGGVFANTISGGIGVTLNTGTVVLTGANTYTGTTTITGGTLQIGAGGTTGSIVGPTAISAGATLAFNRSDALTYAGVVSGSGGIVKTGAGLLVLSATSTYTGGNVITGGTLQIGDNYTSALPTLGGYTLNNGSTLVFSLNSTSPTGGNGTISGTGNVVFSGMASANTYYSTRVFAANGLTYTGTTTINLGTASLGLFVEADAGKTLPSTTVLNVLQGTVNLRQSQTVAGLTGTGGVINANVTASTLTINVDPGVSYTSAAALQNNGVALSLTKSGSGTQILTGSSTATGAITITGGTLQIGAGGTTGSIVANAAVSAGATLAFGRSNALTYSGTISGAGGLAQVGSGTLTLSAANTLTGTTRIVSGGLSLGTALALQNSTLDLNSADSGTLVLGQNSTLGGLTGSRDLDLSGRTLSVGNNAMNTTYSGGLSNGALTKVGAGTLALSGSNTYTGTTTINAGILQFVNPTSLYGGTTANWTAANIVTGSGATLAVSVGTNNFTTGNVTTLLTNLGGLGGAVNNNGLQAGSAIGFDTSSAGGTFTVADSIQNSTGTGGGAVGVVKLGSGTLALTGASTYTGTTVIAAGVLQAGGTGALGSGNIRFTGGTLQYTAATAGTDWATRIKSSGSAITLDTNGQNVTLAGIIDNTNTGGLAKSGGGTLVLTATNTFTGGVTVTGGTLQVGNNSGQAPVPAFGSGYTLANGATLVFSFNTQNNATVTNPISGTGNVVFAGATSLNSYYSTRNFGANGLTYTGTTTVNLDNAANTLYVEFDAGMTLPSTTILNVLSGFVNFRQNQTVAGVTGTGGTIAGEFANSTLTVNVATGTSYTSPTALIDRGRVLALTKSGGGTQILTGASTYTGATTINAGTLQIGSGTVGSLSASTAITGSAGGTLAFTRTDTYGGSFANTIGGGIGLVVNSGTLTLSGSNTYTGTTTINAGTLQIGSGATGSLSASSVITGSAGGTLAFGRTDAYGGGFANTIGGGIGLAVNSGTLSLTGSNAYAGNTTIAGGVLSLGNANALGSGNVLFTGGTLQFTSSNTSDLSTRIQNSTSPVAIDTNGQSVTFGSGLASSNAAGLTKAGSGTLALNAANTYTGTTTIAGGVLQAGNTAALSSGSITFGGGTLQYTAATAGTDWATRFKNSGSAIAVDTNGQTVTLAGIIDSTNTGGITKTGNGTLVVSASSTYTGLTTVSQGVLQSGSTTAATTAIPAGSYAVAAGAKLVFARNVDNVAFSTQGISGAGDVEFQGQAAGYFSFRGSGPIYSASLTYTGQTIVNLTTGGQWYQSALWLEKDNVLPSTTVLNLRSGKVITRNQTGTGISIAGITGSAGTFITTDQTNQKWTVTVASGSSFTYAGVIGLDGMPNLGNSMSFTKAGAGTQVLSGVNTYTGTTTISGGRLEIASSGRINGTARIVLNGSGAELKYNSSTALTQPITFTQGTISGTGSIGTAVTVGTGDTLSPGNSPGTQSYTSGLTWDPAGTYLWEMNDATAGAGTGWDLINVSGGSGLVINATSGTTFKIAITSLSGTAAGSAANFSATTSGSWTILSSASGMSGFSADKFTLDRAAFTNTTGGTFTLSQVASGTNQTLVLAYNTISALTSSTSSVTGFRVIQNQATATSVNLVNSGPDATGYSLSASAALSLPGGSTGTVAGAGTQAISFGYASTATTGVRSGTVSFTNTGNTGDTPGTIAVSGAVVADRVVTASAVNYGLVHVGASGTATSTFTSAGSDNNFTRITVANGSGGGLTVSGSSGFVFDGSGGSSRSVAGTFATAGALSGTISLTNASAETGGTLPGQVPGTTTIAYSASVFSGTGTWNVAGGGSWGSGSSANWTSTGNVQAAPGTFTGYGDTDAAIFAGTQGGTSTILLNGATPSLAAISFTNTTSRYVIDQGSGGSLTLAAASGKPTVDVVAGGLHEIRTAILGSAGLQKLGAGTLMLSGSSSYSGGTDITAGTLAVNGAISGGVSVATGATVGGSGSIAGAITGNGLVSPGNSPGILTAAQFDPSAGLDAAFEFTGLSPTYASAAASVNDIIRLTNLAAPFASGTFASGNVIDVYFNVDSIANGQVYEGGFFTGLSAASLLAALDGTATFNYWAKTAGTPTRTFGGVDYVSLSTLNGITGVTFQTSARTADFGSGPVTGSVTQFVIVPEPTTAGLLAAAALAAGLARAYRRRLAT